MDEAVVAAHTELHRPMVAVRGPFHGWFSKDPGTSKIRAAVVAVKRLPLEIVL
jgi:hypothetical protein